jgi:hypothetical protein
LPIEDNPVGPWEQAWHATMESSVAVRARGVRELCDLLRKGYKDQAAEDMYASRVKNCLRQIHRSALLRFSWAGMQPIDVL